PRPKSPTDIQSFLGLASSYRRFVEACEKSFQELKTQLTIPPMLTLSEGTKDFVVYCDTSRVGFSCTLLQNGNIITYASRQHKIHEKNYPTHDLELVVSLHYVFTKKEPNIRQRRWLELLKNYEMSILYHPGKANVVVVALSKLLM
ncbi:hypothetical protein MTR67_023804, partial [Solanum verrucosum]